MRTFLRSKVTLLFLSLGMLLAFAGVALADVVTVNDAIVTGDKLAKPGTTGTAVVYLTASDNATDDVNGCNANGANPATATLQSSNTSRLTLNSNTVTLNSGCDDTGTTGVFEGSATVGYSVPAGASDGTATISITGVTGGRSGSDWITTDTLNVRVDGTGPAITINTPTAGATYDLNQSVTPSYSCDDGAGNAGVKSCTDNGIDTSTAGNNKTFTVSAEDNLGNKSTASRSYNVVNPDTTPPVITPNITGTEGNNGWYTSDVTVSWTVNDPESSFTTSGCGTSSVTSDTNGVTFTCSATSAGGTDTKSVTIKRDATKPTISGSRIPAANTNGWNNTDVTVSYTCSDSSAPGSGLADGACPADDTVSTEGADQSSTGTVTDRAGNSASATVSGINIDKTDPTINASRTPDANSFGWNNTDVTVSYTCSDNDGGSGLSGACPADDTLSTEAANQSATGHVVDKAGNPASATVSGINIDKTDPSVSLVGGPANGGSYYFGSVPGAPTCSATDLLSGLAAACSISGYDATVGNHTVKAEAKDKADNTGSESRNYDVLGWTFNGFYQPVDMLDGEGKPIVNTVKGGSTVPFKFELFAGPTELTSTSDVKTLKSSPIACSSLPTTVDAIELTATGGTSLRYDTTGGQFVYNWKTPTGAGTCHAVTVTAQDGSYKTAYFKLK